MTLQISKALLLELFILLTLNVQDIYFIRFSDLQAPGSKLAVESAVVEA